MLILFFLCTIVDSEIYLKYRFPLKSIKQTQSYDFLAGYTIQQRVPHNLQSTFRVVTVADGLARNLFVNKFQTRLESTRMEIKMELGLC